MAGDRAEAPATPVDWPRHRCPGYVGFASADTAGSVVMLTFIKIYLSVGGALALITLCVDRVDEEEVGKRQLWYAVHLITSLVVIIVAWAVAPIAIAKETVLKSRARQRENA